MFYKPFNFQQINIAEGTYTPSCVKSLNNAVVAFWERALFQRAASVLDFKLPEDWNGSIYDLFIYCLFGLGYVVVFEDSEMGKVFQPGTLGGVDFWYRPTYATVTNSAMRGGSKQLEIGRSIVAGSVGKCEILKLTPDYIGIFGIISYYAEKLALLDSSINMSLINSKFAYLLGAKTKQAAESLKKMFDKMNAGEPVVIYDFRVQDDPNSKGDPYHFIDRKSIKESYITTDQLRDFRTILNAFDAEIGIPTVGATEKKERLVTDEIQTMKTDALSRSDVWIKTFNESAVAVNERFGLNISASRKENITNGEIDSPGPV